MTMAGKSDDRSGKSGREQGDSALEQVTRELTAVVAAIEAATDTILDAAEQIDALAKTATRDDGVAARLRAQTQRVFEACTFHDLVGQRVAQVRHTLARIQSGTGSRQGAAPDVAAPDVAVKATQDDIDNVFGGGG